MESVDAGSMVTLSYVMKTHNLDGRVKEHPREVLEFILGVEPQVPTLEKGLHGAKAGQKFSLQIPAKEIYGEHDPQLIREIPKKGLIKQRIREGQFYRQMRRKTLISFKVLEIRPNTVLADFNKPMAGVTVSMDVEVLSVRKATQEEIDSARESLSKKEIGCG